jgi:hypothetical protein
VPKSKSQPASTERARKSPSIPDVIDPNRRYNIVVASALLDQSRQKTYDDFEDGKLTRIKDGRRAYVHGSEIIRRSRESDAS